jgi:hypothetical protein
MLPAIVLQTLDRLLPSKIYMHTQKSWRLFVRLRGEGLSSAYHRYRLWSRILATPPIRTAALTPDCDFCVHLMCHEGDYLCAIWALKSFYHQSGKRWPLVIHVQGQSTRRMRKRLGAHFPRARLILQDEADQIVESHLRKHGWHRLLEKRKRLPIMQKLTDVMVAARSRRILILDSDVLFFNYPEELADTHPGAHGHVILQRDYTDGYVLPRSQALSDFGIDLAAQINTGIALLSPESIDLGKCNEYVNHPAFARPSGHIEQTLYALEASRGQRVHYLPSEYFVTTNQRMDCGSLKARHYAGPSRPLLTSEGIPYLVQAGFLEALRNGRPAGPNQKQSQTIAFKETRVGEPR